MTRDWISAIGSELVFEKRTAAMTNLVSSRENQSQREPALATSQETAVNREKKTGMSQKALNCSQSIVATVLVNKRQGVMK